MLKYDKIDITEGIDIDKTNKSRECMFCHYWYYLIKTLKISTGFKNIVLFMLKKLHTELILKILVNIKQKS